MGRGSRESPEPKVLTKPTALRKGDLDLASGVPAQDAGPCERQQELTVAFATVVAVGLAVRVRLGIPPVVVSEEREVGYIAEPGASIAEGCLLEGFRRNVADRHDFGDRNQTVEEHPRPSGPHKTDSSNLRAALIAAPVPSRGSAARKERRWPARRNGLTSAMEAKAHCILFIQMPRLTWRSWISFASKASIH
jgi:hypothetical protein